MAKKSADGKTGMIVPLRAAVIMLAAVLIGVGAGILGWFAGHGPAAAVLEGVGAAGAAVYFFDRFIA